jgi:phosphoserine phosphatase
LADAFYRLAGSYRDGTISHDDLAGKAEPLYLEALRAHDPRNVRRVASTFVATDRQNLRPFTAQLLAYLHAADIDIVIVSGVPSVVLQCYRHFLPISEIWGLEAMRRRSTWNLRRNTALSGVKLQIVREIARTRRVLVAFGDSDSDLPLLRIAEIPVVVGSTNITGHQHVLRLEADGTGYDEVVRCLELAR